ncbi:adenosylcobinamide-GDP ribazoletransferase [Larsenimonas rhizosphaerae]|uniref:adenosylcobinamide-GDP ribazoletransferase n=1 Tax=Larsenimonas rhizosphaerae TaxID=2944682 RepID=UPI0020345FAA|nr:adenosylcobinamide-GDP ribazoletransferase [Larsenimonas rhizosphaerae]
MSEKAPTEWRRLGWALSFLTRLPAMTQATPRGNELASCPRYFPLIGAGLGLLAGSIMLAGQALWPAAVAVLLGLGVLILVTGGLHEDGLADTVDGLGGGMDVTARLRIMKDSRVGSYGVLALVLSLMLRGVLLTLLAMFSPLALPGILVAGQGASRALAVSLMPALNYVRLEDSKVRAVTQELDRRSLWVALGTGGLLLCLGLGFNAALIVGVALAVLWWGLRSLYRRQLGGYTGDTLGAAQQAAELVIYLVVAALWLN